MADSGSAKTALVLGGTGETGKIVVQELQDSSDIAKVIMINRRNVDVAGDKVNLKCQIFIFLAVFLFGFTD